MKSGKNNNEPGKTPVPAYIVTFSDMVTLLLTFFVLLLSLAEKQDSGLFQKGLDSFQKAIADFGLSGLLFNRDPSVQFDHPRIKYKTDKAQDEPEDPSVDQTTETLKRILEEIEHLMKIQPSQITCNEKIFLMTDIAFPDGEWRLDAKSRARLDLYVAEWRESFALEKPILYVVGTAAGEHEETQQYLVSARRAQAVANHLRTAFGSDAKWTIYSWGAGAGGAWTAQGGQFSSEMHIAIAVLTQNKRSNR